MLSQFEIIGGPGVVVSVCNSSKETNLDCAKGGCLGFYWGQLVLVCGLLGGGGLGEVCLFVRVTGGKEEGTKMSSGRLCGGWRGGRNYVWNGRSRCMGLWCCWGLGIGAGFKENREWVLDELGPGLEATVQRRVACVDARKEQAVGGSSTREVGRSNVENDGAGEKYERIGRDPAGPWCEGLEVRPVAKVAVNTFAVWVVARAIDAVGSGVEGLSVSSVFKRGECGSGRAERPGRRERALRAGVGVSGRLLGGAPDRGDVEEQRYVIEVVAGGRSAGCDEEEEREPTRTPQLFCGVERSEGEVRWRIRADRTCKRA
ncbi:hypothetical protein Tco_0748701 [Tanacetum coccineum]|uniref:Uncharacterized protein n=1 Tax=Tanacetum coccineum TaxID=301880 RepID=A0ABQ4YXB0_9ASTR